MRSLLLLSLLVMACATPYQARKWAGGYIDRKLAADEYSIAFEANGYTEDFTARAYLRYRCAEITKQNGYDYYVLVDGQDNTSLSIGPNLGLVEKPAYSARIKLGKGPRPTGTNAWVADDVMRELEPQIKRP